MPFEQDPNQQPPAGQTEPDGGQAGGQPAQQPAGSAPEDHNKVFLVAGERAFRDPTAVVTHIEHAQSHIATLEAERQTDRERLAAQDAELARLKKIEEGLTGREVHPGNADQTEQLSKEEIVAHAAKLAVGMIAQTKTKEAQDANLAAAEQAAKETYGESYHDKVGEIAQGLNMTLAQVDALGRESPAAFKRLFLPSDPGQPHQPSNGTVIPPTGQQQQQQKESVNIVKLREKDRISHVSSLMKAAGVDGY